MIEKKFLFFLEREFHIALLKQLMSFIHKEKLGEMKIYAPFCENINILIRNNFNFHIETTKDPWSWRPDITFMADFSYQYVEGLGKIVNIGHGTICKGWFFSKNKISQRENCADLICVPGRIHKERLEKQVFKPIVVTGMPKLDNCFNGTLNKAEIIKKIGFDPHQKTVLLAPTFNSEFSILPYLENIDLMKVFPEYINLIIKLHGVVDNKYKTLFNKLKNENRKVYICDSYDIDELFFITDLLITDVSSVIYEFLHMKKPILLFDSPKQKTYINYDERDLEWEYRDVGYRFDNIEKLSSLIFKALTSNQIALNNIADMFIGVQDGSSTAKVIEASLSLFEYNTESEITIITNNISKDLMERFSHLYPVREIKGKNTIKAIAEVAATIKTKYIIYLDADYEYSPQIINLLLNQIKQNDKVGIVVPLINDNDVHLQQIRFRINIEQDFNFYQTAIQLAYSFTGQSQEIDFIKSNCFIICKNLFINKYFSNLENELLSIHELITHTIMNNYKVLLAFDCLVNRKIHQLQKISDQTFEYEEALHKEISSISELSEEELKQKIYENPHNENTIVKLIQHYYNKQQWEQLDVYADMVKNNLEVIFYGIKSLENQNFLEEAYNRLIKIDIDMIKDKELSINYMILKAKLLIKLNKTDEVLSVLNKALKINPHNFDILLTRGIYHLSQGSTREAIEDFDAVLFQNPQNIKALHGKAIVLQAENKTAESSMYFLKILQKDEENLEAINGLLKNSYSVREFIDIEKALDNYLSFHPSNLDILFTLACICVEMNKYDKSRELLDRIMIFEPSFYGVNELYEKINLQTKNNFNQKRK